MSRRFVPFICFLGVLFCFAVEARDTKPRSGISAGQKALSFRATTLDGKTINFPEDYKGKVVLLDFWATWCPPCRAELPKVTAAYEQFHEKGFEVISVSLDHAKQGPMLLQFVKDNKMTWSQIYDGRYWKAAIAQQYGVKSIPCPVVVDGDTGVIIATDNNALGQRLTKALNAGLAAKAKK